MKFFQIFFAGLIFFSFITRADELNDKITKLEERVNKLETKIGEIALNATYGSRYAMQALDKINVLDAQMKYVADQLKIIEKRHTEKYTKPSGKMSGISIPK